MFGGCWCNTSAHFFMYNIFVKATKARNICSMFLHLFFGDLGEYDLALVRGRKPVQKAQVKEPAPDTDGKRRWFQTDPQGATMAWDSTTNFTTGDRIKTLDGWDVTYLQEKFADTVKGYDPALAAALKIWWATIDPNRPGEYYSAARVETEALEDGKPKAGFSERNIKKYFHAFNLAQQRREDEKQKQV